MLWYHHHHHPPTESPTRRNIISEDISVGRYLKMLWYRPAMLCCAMLDSRYWIHVGKTSNLIARAMFSCCYHHHHHPNHHHHHRHHHHHHHHIWDHMQCYWPSSTLTVRDTILWGDNFVGVRKSWRGLPVPNGRNAQPRWPNLVMGSIYPPFQLLILYLYLYFLFVFVFS